MLRAVGSQGYAARDALVGPIDGVERSRLRTHWGVTGVVAWTMLAVLAVLAYHGDWVDDESVDVSTRKAEETCSLHLGYLLTNAL